MKSSRTLNDNRQRVIEVGRKIISRKGFSAVGLNEILTAAGIPKGSFYYYFASKEAFGTQMLEDYFARYLETMEALLSSVPDATQAMMNYWHSWTATDDGPTPKGYQCLAVKLGAEVSDLSEPMRLALEQGTTRIVQRLAGQLERMAAENSFVPPPEGCLVFAGALYQLWLGASLMGKMTGSLSPLASAMPLTKRLLQL
ncbi:TetR/AcrR family transcriptional regulator [Tatumella sp. JGM118]|uniref:TetR/AcrR family transcriptional regulator n=1 Tax=Tatumella terrea TaxID=419007 RepID=A0ABW1W3W7_9GAMM|nr:TetR/AcrR family transcriptional regulator [Tatumella sp. JGM118]MBS0908604.1 TetR/AcrR family transcriptional regulator [Tatumella sp. JGM118]